MKIEKFDGYLLCETPISHGGSERLGNDVALNRMAYIVDGEKREIPFISANGIRGLLRRYVMSDFLSQLNYQVDSKKIFRFLMAGGILESVGTKDQGTINLSMREEIREYLPPVDLLGGTLGNQNMDGCLDVFPGQPICTEIAEYLPPDLQIKPNYSVHEFLDWKQGTTMDPIRAGRPENHLTSTTLQGESEKEGEDKSAQMIYNWETFIPGTPLCAGFVLRNASSLARSCFVRMLNLWKKHPIIGGKGATGHGRVKICIDFEKEDEEKYLEFLHSNKPGIVTVLDKLCGDWKP